MNIYEKLQEARVELQKMNLKKSGFNKFANFDYFELKDFLPKINEIFLKLKLFSKFDLLDDKGILTIINAEKTDEKETFVTPKIVVEMKGQNGLQQIGSTHTYLKRYCYYNALEIIINDETEATIDKDKTNSNNKKETKKEISPEEKRAKGLEYIKKHREKYEKIVDKHLLANSKVDIDELTNEQVSELANNINNLEKANMKKGA